MKHFPIRDLARMSFPGRAPGWFVMLEGYFDDGGTHDGSEVVVWGGVMGDTEWFAKLEQAWLPLLAEPMAGKPRIKQFHHALISNGWKEFVGYKPPERDVVIKNFRDAVIGAGLIPVSFAISAADWRELAPYEVFGTAEQFAFMCCVYAAFRMAAIGGAPVALQFDSARLETSRQPIIDGVQHLFQEQIVNVGFSRCQDSVGLQAADLVAYESYLLSLKVLRENVQDPRPHFKRLLEGVPAAHGFFLGRREIASLALFAKIFMTQELRAPSERTQGFQNLFDHLFGDSGGPDADV